MFEQIRSLIESHDTIILHRHTKPDGDALGSQFGLKYLLQLHYPDKHIYAVGDDAGRYAFIGGQAMDEVADAQYASALAIILDTSAPHLISDTRYTMAHATARIDHHLFIDKIADAEVVDSSFESCCGLIAAMAKECGYPLSLPAAQALYTGMVTDSGRFRYDAVNARTFELAAYLMQQPIDTAAIYEKLYAMDYEQAQQRARYQLKMRLSPHRVGYVYTTRDELNGQDPAAISRGMVNVMADIAGVPVWVNFTECDQGVLCELRSSRININPVAVAFGGGGHQKASGATVPDRETALRMLDELDKLVEETL